MVAEGKGGARAGGRDLKFIDNLFPKLVIWDTVWASARDHGFVEFAEVKFFATKRGDFEIFNTKFSLELDEAIFEVLAFSSFVVIIHKLEFFRDWELLA